MDTFLDMSSLDRHLACVQAEERLGLQAASIEKDLWVCWALREAASLPDLGSHLTFKGGTSLSKGWKLIERFSEDIDLVVDRQTLGFGGDASPEHAASKNARKRLLKELVTAARQWVQERLLPAMADRINARVGPLGPCSLSVDPDAEDGQCLLFQYPGVFGETEAGYVRPVVRIELGARSDDWPSEPRQLVPYLAEALPDIAPNAGFEFRTLTAERTFWEKAMLLHEETFRPADKPPKLRMARHYYDLWCLITKGVAERAAGERALFERIAEHRETFFNWSWMDYATLRPGALRLLPVEAHASSWRQDYGAMSRTMFFGTVPAFDEVLSVVGEFQRRFNEGA